MNTPICDFVREYAASGALRLHMPGHKGARHIGVEEMDITEIEGADSLYEAAGIIRESEKNASELFGCPTFYSTEGSSQCIRAMLMLASVHAREMGIKPVIAAGRNAHKTFLSGAALMDIDVRWLYSENDSSYLSCRITAAQLENMFSETEDRICAVYITSPDYLGNITPIREIADVCHKYGALLIVDNAHGAYLKFLPVSQHPIDLGADICCDSAHKTLPALTGGAYLHVSEKAPDGLLKNARHALAMFGSTSPSYLIMQSLDAVNAYIADGYPSKLEALAENTAALRARLEAHGWMFTGDEHTKLTICAKMYGYTGSELASVLSKNGIICEFADPDYLVLMLTTETGADGLRRLETVLNGIQQRSAVVTAPPTVCRPVRALSVRDAAFSAWEEIPVSESEGRILAAATVGCPPAVPIVVCGERIDAAAIKCFEYYGINSCIVVK